MHKGRIAYIGSNTISSWLLHLLLDIHYGSLIANHIRLKIGTIDDLFVLHSHSLLGALPTLDSAHLALLLSAHLSWCQTIFLSILSLLYPSAHDDHSKLLFHHKIILLNKVHFLFSFAITHSIFELFNTVYFISQILSSFQLFHIHYSCIHDLFLLCFFP